MSAYKSIKIPKELVEEIDHILENGTLGYKSRMEFVKDAIRRSLIDNSNLRTNESTLEAVVE